MDDDATNLDMVRDLVRRANTNTVADAADLDQCIRSHDLVFGVWQEDGLPLGVGHLIIKGRGALERIKRTGAGGLTITAVRCQSAEQAEAVRQVFGDQPAQVLPLRDP